MNEGLARTGYRREKTGPMPLPVIGVGVRTRALWAHAANDNRRPLRRRLGRRGAVLLLTGVLLVLLAAL